MQLCRGKGVGRCDFGVKRIKNPNLQACKLQIHRSGAYFVICTHPCHRRDIPLLSTEAHACSRRQHMPACPIPDLLNTLVSSETQL